MGKARIPANRNRDGATVFHVHGKRIVRNRNFDCPRQGERYKSSIHINVL